MVESTMRVKAICVYPIKSLRGCTLPSLTASATGFSYDRRFILQRAHDDKAMYIGKVLEMSLFTTELSPEEKPVNILVRYTLDHVFDRADEKIERQTLEVPVHPDWKGLGLAQREVDLHGSPAVGYEMGEKYDAWFSKRFGYPVRLVYLGDNRREVLGNLSPNAKSRDQPVAKQGAQGWLGSARASVGGLISTVASYTSTGGDGNSDKKENANDYKGIDQGIGWADVAPFLIINQNSYEDAASRLQPGADLDIFKFRPNLIVEGSSEEPFAEDFWAELAIISNGTNNSNNSDSNGNGDSRNETRVVLTSNCARCSSLNVDFETGKQGQGEAGKILKLLQKDRRVDLGMKYSPVFGRYGFLASRGSKGGEMDGVWEGEEEEEVVIRVGDVVRVVKRNEERTRFQWPGVSTDN